MTTYIWVNIGLCNGLLPNGTKTGSMLIYHQFRSLALTYKTNFRSAEDITISLENTHVTSLRANPLGCCFRPSRFLYIQAKLTHWGHVTHICVGKLTIIGSDNSLSPGRRQAIIWTNAGIMLIRPLGTNSEILIGIQTFSFKKMYLKMSSAKWRPFCLGLYVLTDASTNGCHFATGIFNCISWNYFNPNLTVWSVQLTMGHHWLR